jgi:PAS domain-containing protein
MTDAQGRITYYNEAAVALAGRRPALGQDRWCVTWHLYQPNGTLLPHDRCPMAIALKENRPVQGVEAVAERPDGTRISILPFPTPLHDASGALVGGVNMLVETTHHSPTTARPRTGSILIRGAGHHPEAGSHGRVSRLRVHWRLNELPCARLFVTPVHRAHVCGLHLKPAAAAVRRG